MSAGSVILGAGLVRVSAGSSQLWTHPGLSKGELFIYNFSSFPPFPPKLTISSSPVLGEPSSGSRKFSVSARS